MKHMWSEEEIEKLPKNINTIKDNEGNPYFMIIEGVCNLPNASEIKKCHLIKNGSTLWIQINGLHPQGSIGLSTGSLIASFDIPVDWEKYFVTDSNGVFSGRYSFAFYNAGNSNQSTGNLNSALQLDKNNHKLNLNAVGTIPSNISADSYFKAYDWIPMFA